MLSLLLIDLLLFGIEFIFMLKVLLVPLMLLLELFELEVIEDKVHLSIHRLSLSFDHLLIHREFLLKRFVRFRPTDLSLMSALSKEYLQLTKIFEMIYRIISFHVDKPLMIVLFSCKHLPEASIIMIEMKSETHRNRNQIKSKYARKP